MMAKFSTNNLRTIGGEGGGKKDKILCSCMKRRRMLIKRKGKKYSNSATAASRFGFICRGNTSKSHFFCKAVVLLVILEGLGRESTGATMIAPVEGPSSSSSGGGDGGNWQSNHQYQQQQSTFFGGGGGGDSDGEEDDNRFGGGTGADSFISTFAAGNRAEAARRMRDRCGRYSLLKVLQQWENLQRRCRASIRNILNTKMSGSYNNNNNNGTSYQFYGEDAPSPSGPDRYDFMVAPPSPPRTDDSDNPEYNAEDNIRGIEKRSRHHYYSAISKLRINNNDDDNEFRNYYYEVNGDALESCCPVVFEVIAPIYGRNRSGHMVELYKDENVQQKFNEYRCHKDYVEKPCRFVEGQYRRISKCVQQYLDTYALVRSDTSLTGWSMEHIRVASGCACKVDPSSRRRKKVSSAQQQEMLVQQQRRNQRRSQQYRDSDFYKFGGSLMMGKKKSSKPRSLEQQLLRYPGLNDY